MSDRVNLLQRVTNLETSPAFNTYSKVVIHVDDETDIVAGNDLGRTFEITNPFGTQAMANNLLNKLVGYQYQPGKATGALLDPAAEIGDGISVAKEYWGMYTREKTFSRLMKSDISAPHDEEINHEYKYESPTERKFSRQIDDVKASIIIQANQILAQVVKQVDGNTSSFGWTLTASGWTVYSNGSPVLTVNRNGLEVAGTIKAGTKIGSGSGFTISAKAIYNNISSMSGTQSSGIYIGTDGIKLGQNFNVTSAGNVTANNMVLNGTLTVGGANITAANLRLGAERANSGYSGWNGTTNTVNNNSGNWTNGYNWGNNFNEMVNNRWTAKYLKGQYIYATSNVNTPILIVADYSASWQSIDFYDRDGNHIYLRYLGR